MSHASPEALSDLSPGVPTVVPIQPLSEALAAPFAALSDGALHAAVRRLTARSNIALADLLAHLGEVESRGIHRERACSSLYTYCIYELRMSEDAAYRRAKAARVVRQHPDLRDVLARGEIHLTGLLMIAPYLGGERHAEVLERARFRTKRELARLVAELDPKAVVPAQITPLAPAPGPKARTLEEALAGPVRDLRAGDRPADWIAPTTSDGDAPATTDRDVPATTDRDAPVTTDRDAAEPTASYDDQDNEEVTSAASALESAWQARKDAPPDRPLCYEIRFTASQEFVDLLEEAFSLLGGPRSAARLPEVQLRALRQLVERLRKQKIGAKATPERGAKTEAGEIRGTRAPRGATGPAPERGADTEAGAKAAPERANTETRGTQGSRTPRGATGPAPERGAKTEGHGTQGTRTPRGAAGPAPERGAEPEGKATRHSAPVGRAVPVPVRGAVWSRDGARCAFVDARGRRCAETHGLEFHHRKPYGRGGPATVANIEVRCRAHNDLAAEQDFGRAHMKRMRNRRD